ncbi:MAG TPA: type III pantothenate kinase [bacterium]|nr:type III pantothenate kinase [bacterium]HQO36270.1 type III pantothenate kinase [bacterium]HQQ00871.1 type III pantothenate kinase [bacterium]
MEQPVRTLAVDIGNTRIKLGLFVGENLAVTEDFPSSEEISNEILSFLEKNESPDRCIMSSVVPSLRSIVRDTIEERCRIEVKRTKWRVRELVPMQVEQPDQVGTDRLVNSLAAIRLYGPPCIVVSLGTATTFEIISGDGVYLGGCIVPGVGIAKEALSQRAALLPPYPWRKMSQLLGKTTLQQMEIGLYQGTKCLVQGMIAAYRRDLGEAYKSIGTGGYSQFLAEDGLFDIYDPHLGLKGLYFTIHSTHSA